jgi:sigma-B regulation protein RsbU (phosphoserine phosphatase)
MKMKPKFKITSKILSALAGLSLISLCLSGYIAYTSMRGLGRYALRSSTALGDKAVNDSIKALKAQAEGYLLKLAQDQAALSNALLEKVQNEVNIMAAYATDLWGKRAWLQQHRPSYSQSNKPKDVYAASVYVLAPKVSWEKVKQEVAMSSEMDEIFIPLHANDKNLDSLCIGTKTGITRSYPWMAGFDPKYDPRKRSWYQQAVKKGGMVWTKPYIHAVTRELIITCAKPFYGAKHKLIGVVEADLTLKIMNEKIMSTQIGELGYAFLLDKHGKVIARPGLSAKDTRWDETYKTENFLTSHNPELKSAAQNMVTGQAGICTCRFSDGQKYIAYAPLPATNWILGIVMPVKEIIAPALATQQQILAASKDAGREISEHNQKMVLLLGAAFVVIIMVVFTLAFTLSRKMTRPILALNEGAKIVGSGNLEYRLEIKTGDEIETLADTFNKMTDDLKIYIHNLKATTAAKERIESELKIAHEIQGSMIPRIFPPFPARKEFSLFASMEPAKEVGGDFYDFFFIDEDRLCFLIGDVSGKGVPAALFMVICKTLLKNEALQGILPEEILFRVNNLIYPDNEACMFVTLFCVILNTRTGEIEFANGGHNPPLLYAGQGEFQYMDMPKGFVVGPMPNSKYEKKKLILKPGDIIFLYTDGVTEAMDPEGKLFSEAKLKVCLSGMKNQAVADIVHGIRAEITGFARGAMQSDDITMLALQYQGRSGEAIA